jgi:hypothetical protein
MRESKRRIAGSRVDLIANAVSRLLLRRPVVAQTVRLNYQA